MVVKAGFSLEELWIENFDGMEALPNWLGIPLSLQKLSLYFCQKLMCLPILHFTNLKHLHIAYCPNLEKRCADGSSTEWLKMTHIPNIKINGKYIQGGEDSDDSEDFDDLTLTNLMTLKMMKTLMTLKMTLTTSILHFLLASNLFV